MKEALGPSFVQGSLSPEILKLPLGELKHAGINIKLTNPLNGGMDYNVDILIEKKPGLVIYEISEEGTRNERRCANIELWILEYSHITQYHSSFSSTGKQRNPRPEPIHHHHHRSDITFQVVSTRDWLQPILARKKSASTPLLLLHFSVFHRFSSISAGHLSRKDGKTIQFHPPERLRRSVHDFLRVAVELDPRGRPPTHPEERFHPRPPPTGG